jgi:glyoxylate reductase
MKVFITRKIPQAGVDLLKKAKIQVKMHNKEEEISRKEFLKNAIDAEGLICLLSEKITEETMDALPRLQIISNYAVGYNNIDIPAATKRGIAVTNTPGALTDATADIALALLLCTARRIVEADRFTRAGKFKGWVPSLMLGTDLRNKTLGIIGFGRIGKAVAERAKGFGMKIIYHSQKSNEEVDPDFKKVGFKQLLTKSDFISLHVPLNDSTYHMIGKPELSLMKKEAILINTSRGEVIDEKVLIEFLKKKKIKAAGFDVYENEPNINKEFFKLENVVLLPHIGSAALETRTNMAIIAAKNIIADFNRRIPEFIVNPEIYNNASCSCCCGSEDCSEDKVIEHE